MNSFMVSVDSAGIIADICWSEPAYLMAMPNASICELFPADEQETVRRLIKKSIKQERLLRGKTDLHLKYQSAKISLSFLKTDDHVLVFAREDDDTLNRQAKIRQAEIEHKFMETMKTYFKNNPRHNDETAGNEYNKIQLLNNQLINTKRMLEKSNVQLNRLNEVLNNRLVTDDLTGLVSRYQYRTEIDFVIMSNPGKLGIFIYLDIDDFKGINDQYGHAVGDQYLIQFADRLKNLPFKNLIKLRIAGDEFGLFFYGLNDAGRDRMEKYWDEIKEHVLSCPIEISGVFHDISISAGMAVYGVDTSEIYEIIQYADFAMYQGKKNGKNCYRHFDKEAYLCRENAGHR